MSEGRNSINLPTPDPKNENDDTPKVLVETTSDQNDQANKLELITEAVKLAEEVVGVMDSYFDYRGKREKWRGRVEEAKLQVEEAKVSLEETKDTNDAERERIKAVRKQIDPVSEMLEDFLAEMQTLEGERREHLRDEAIRAAELLTKIKI